MKYKGYTADIQYHPDDRIFFGIVRGIDDGITFQGTSVDQLEKEFQISVNEYLRMCKEFGREPQKPHSGKFVLRMKPELHARLISAAKEKQISLNALIVDTLEKAI